MLAQHVESDEQAIRAVEVIYTGVGGHKLNRGWRIHFSTKPLGNDEVSVGGKSAGESGNGKASPGVRCAAGEFVGVAIAAIVGKLEVKRARGQGKQADCAAHGEVAEH